MRQSEETRPRPEGETRSAPGGGTRTQVEERSLTRALAQDLVTLGLGSTVTGVGLKVGSAVGDGLVAKVQDVLKPEPSKIELPPGAEE